MFTKGQSGNPGGRPKGLAEVRELAQRLTARSFEELERIAFESPDDRAPLAAIGMILERGYGKPAQPMDGDGEGGPMRYEIRWAGSSSEAGSLPDRQ